MDMLWFEHALLPTGWAEDVRLTLNSGRIAAVETGVESDGAECHGTALPGLPNLHSHAFQRGMAGLTEHRGPGDDSFWTWRELMYRFVERLTPDDLHAIAAQAFVEMLESGFTRVGEFHYLHHAADGGAHERPAEMAAAIAAAAEETGIALTLLPVFYAHSDFGGAPPTPRQRRFVCDLDGYAKLLEDSRRAVADLPDSRVGIAPHSLRAVTEEEFGLLLELSPTGPVHIHAAEQEAEVARSIDVLGARPVEWLLANAAIDPRWCLVHATHMTDTECDALAASGAVTGLCPITEANLGDGVFPAERFLAAGGAVGVGSDSNVLIDAPGELRLLEYGQRLIRRGRNRLVGDSSSVGRTLFDKALAGGAQALGCEAGIAAGAPGDLFTLDMSHPALGVHQGDRLLDAWVFAGNSGSVASVWRAGRKMVRDGRHVAAEPVAARYFATVRRLIEA